MTLYTGGAGGTPYRWHTVQVAHRTGGTPYRWHTVQVAHRTGEYMQSNEQRHCGTVTAERTQLNIQ